MKHVVHTAFIVKTGKGDEARDVPSGKAIVQCQSVNEAREIADGFNSIPNRVAFAGVELYTQGGVKVLLSYADVHDIASVARDIGPALSDFSMAAE